jgi:tetratricopeptide (TPR) repeat protein
MKSKNKRVIIITMITLVFVSIIVSKLYYQNVNNAVDPRIVPARKMYDRYNELTENNDFIAVFQLLDSIETIYNSFPHYKHSFEKGVMANNKAAVYLTLAMHKDSIFLPSDNERLRNIPTDSLLKYSFNEIETAISMYENWKNTFSSKSETDIKQMIENEFLDGLSNYAEEDQQTFLGNRVKELISTQQEIDRRLSVAYTNKGMVYRMAEDYESAILCYKKAIDLWDQNLTAENNLNILFGKPIKKRSIIEKLFPPEKE